jgi:hypothetical protein
VAGVLAVRVLPHVVLGTFAGVISDFFDRRRILLLDKSAIALLNVAFAALLLGGALELWHVYAYGVLRGALMAFDQPARQALIPTLVPAELITNAVALMSAVQNTMRIAGGVLGGFLYYAFGAAGSFLAIAFVYLGALVTTYLLDVPSNARRERVGVHDIGAGLLEGLRFGLREPAVRGVLILTLVFFSFCMMFTQVFLPILAEQVLAVGSRGFGLFSALLGLGALGSALLIARVQPVALGRVLPWLVLVAGAMLISFSLATFLQRPWSLALPAVAAVALGAMQTSFFSLSRSLLLSSSPSALHARVMSLLSFDRAFMSAGAAAGGLLTAAIGVQLAVISYGAAAIACALAVRLFARSFRSAAIGGTITGAHEAVKAA